MTFYSRLLGVSKLVDEGDKHTLEYEGNTYVFSVSNRDFQGLNLPRETLIEVIIPRKQNPLYTIPIMPSLAFYDTDDRYQSSNHFIVFSNCVVGHAKDWRNSSDGLNEFVENKLTSIYKRKKEVELKEDDLIDFIEKGFKVIVTFDFLLEKYVESKPQPAPTLEELVREAKAQRESEPKLNPGLLVGTPLYEKLRVLTEVVKTAEGKELKYNDVTYVFEEGMVVFNNKIQNGHHLMGVRLVKKKPTYSSLFTNVQGEVEEKFYGSSRHIVIFNNAVLFHEDKSASGRTDVLDKLDKFQNGLVDTTMINLTEEDLSRLVEVGFEVVTYL